ncbi:MAG: DNA topoisomerase IV subunit A [Deltaproteobacteria bacterium]|jgi:topoisomerase-4 subunit A|nr:DNA topoisomerase IV subunit A [Deltaproteobacteria bacterium]
MQDTANFGKLHKLFDENFIEYTSYVIKERAIPDMSDGLKPVQRRILQTLYNMDDGRFQKVANVVGETMKLHPHGDASIFGALVNLANKDILIERQGNFGNIFTGDQASAARYIECRLTPLAKETLFNKDLTEFQPSYDGRMQEPVTLPAKTPLLLLLGAEGIAVGMATKIMPHNFRELLRAQKKILKGLSVTLYPDFQHGGLLDVSGYNNGNGRLKCRAKIVEKNDKTIVIEEIPYSTTTSSIIDSIEKADKSGKIKIQSINDYTAEKVEIEIKLARGIYAKDTIKALYAFTDCEVSISPNLTVIKDNSPVSVSVEEVLRDNTEQLVKNLETELQIELSRLQEKLHARTLEQIFIEERIYKKIEECKSYKAVIDTVDKNLAEFAAKLVKPVSREDIERLLEIRIKRISRFDIDRQRKEIKDIKNSIKEVNKKLKDIVNYTIGYLDNLLKKYGRQYPRRTTIETFTEVKARKVALSNLTIGYHRETGLLGYQVKTDPDMSVPCSEYDKILLIYRDGRYKAIKVPEKIFVDHDVYWIGKVAGKTIFNLLYREGTKNFTFIKRFKTPKFILDKEYRLFPAHKKSWIQFLQTGEGVRARIDFVPTKRSKINSQRLEFDEYLIKGGGALGKRLSTRTVRRITELTTKVAEQNDANGTEKKDTTLKQLRPNSAPNQKKEASEKENVPSTEPLDKTKENKSQLGLFDLNKKE